MLRSPSWLPPGSRRQSRWRLKSRTAILHIHKSVTPRRHFHGRGGVASGHVRSHPSPPGGMGRCWNRAKKKSPRSRTATSRRQATDTCSRPGRSTLRRPGVLPPSGPEQDLGSLTPLQTLSPVARCRQTAWLIFRQTHDRPRSLHEKACLASRRPPGGHSTRAFRHCRLDQGDRRPLPWQATFRRETSTAPRTRPCAPRRARRVSLQAVGRCRR